MSSASETVENSVGDNSVEDSKLQVGNFENKIKLTDLKLQDLKVELEKRNLDKAGIESVLVERLKTALLEKGEDPDNFDFDSVDDNLSRSSFLNKKRVSNAETNGDVISKEEMSDSIEFDSKDEVICDIGDETIDINIDNDDKCSNEVTLQLSIDEEEAQLNDDENILDITKTNDIKNNFKVNEVDKATELTKENKSPVKKSSPVSSKVSKLSNEDKEVKKKVLQSSKAVTVCDEFSTKAFKILGKNEKNKSASALARGLYITGLPGSTRAAELKVLFSKQGRVLSVKIVKSTKQTPGKCYGFVTMATSKDASKAIQNLHHTELNGCTISIERSESDSNILLKKPDLKLVSSKLVKVKKQIIKKERSKSKAIDSSKSSSSSEHKTNKQRPKIIEAKDIKNFEKSKEKKEFDRSKIRNRERKSRESKSKDREFRDRMSRNTVFRRPPIIRPRQFSFIDRPRFGASRRVFTPRPYLSGGAIPNARIFRPSRTAYSLEKIRAERLRLRAEREIEKRRIEEITRHRYIENKQREEAYRLEREKEKLRIEREMFEREKAELLKLEREKQRLELEKLEREREELRHQTELRRSSKRSITHGHERHSEQFWDTRKKMSHYEARASFSGGTSSNPHFEYSMKKRPATKHEYDRKTEQYSHKMLEPRSRIDYEQKREITIRSRDERQVIDRHIFKADRDARSSFQHRERHSSLKKEASRIDWKHDRKVHERVISSTSNTSSRRMYY